MIRYYVTAIQHNRISNAENRTVPFAFDDYNSAIQKFHAQLGSDMNNQTLDWSVVIVWDSDGRVLRTEKWTRTEWEEPEQEE